MDIPLLTTGESKVYKGLVTLGESTVGNIIKTSQVSHSKIYDILKRLSDKGLVSSINKNGKQYFSASDPDRLHELVEEKKQELEEHQIEIEKKIKQLKTLQNTSQPVSLLSAYEGFKGMKSVLDSLLEKLKKHDELLVLGSPKQFVEQAGGFLKDWQKRRIKKGVICKINFKS